MTQIIKGPIRHPFSHLYLSLWAPVEQLCAIKYQMKEKHWSPTAEKAAHLVALLDLQHSLNGGHEAHEQNTLSWLPDPCVVTHILWGRRSILSRELTFLSSLGVKEQRGTLNPAWCETVTVRESNTGRQVASVTHWDSSALIPAANQALYFSLMTLGMTCAACIESIGLNVNDRP